MAGALEGIRVIDFGQYIAGPLVAMLLSDQGADVIRVDPPGGPRWSHPANATLNRGKRRLELDLRDPAGKTAALSLIGSADVVIENFRPGVMESLGLAWEQVSPDHERLIYCSIPAFAADDPRARLPGWEGVVAAATGAFPTRPGRRHPASAVEPEAVDAPRFTALPLASEYGAVAAAIGIAMALIARERDGLGQCLEIPLFNAMFLAIGSSGLLVNGGPSGGRPMDPWGGIFPAKGEGRVLMSLPTPRFLDTFLKATGKDREWEDKGYLAADAVNDKDLMARLQQDLVDVFMSRTADEWDELATEVGVPVTPVRQARGWMEAKHTHEAGIFVLVDDPEFGPMVQPGPSIKLNGTPGGVQAPRAATASPGIDGIDVTAAIAGPTKEQPLSAPLEGFRVIDTTSILAGPTAGRTLAEFGAEVIKVNNPWEQGSGYRWQVHRYHSDVNRGKKSILIDLKQPAGLDLLWRLVEKSDVYLQNMRLGVAQRLGVAYADVKKHKPDIVYLSISAFGYGGEWEYRPGYEPVAQSFSGMQARGPQPYAVNDYCTGLLGAFGVGLALFHRLRSGEGQSVETSLAHASTYLQLPYMQLYAGKKWDEPSGPHARGWSPLQRMYRASDGWFFLGAASSQIDALASIAGLEAAKQPTGDALAGALEAAFAGKTAAAWVKSLTAAGLGAYPIGITEPELMADPWVVDHGLSVTQTYKDGSRITTIGPPWRLSRTPPSVRHLVSPPGGDAYEVIAKAGLKDRFEELVREKAVLLE